MAVSLVWFLAALLAVSLTPAPTSVVNSCIESEELRSAEDGAATPPADADRVVPLDATTKSGWQLCAPRASRVVSTVALWFSEAHVLGAHCDRAPPVA